MGSPSTATSLLRRLQSHDHDAWQTLTQLYGPLVFHWCRRMGLDEHTSADVFQEVFASVATAIHRFDPEGQQGSFRGWMWRITRNKVLDVHRRRQSEPGGEGGTVAQLRFSQLPDPFTDDSLDKSDQIESTSLIHRALEIIRAEFEPRTWQAFWQTVVEQHSTAEVAADLQLSTAAVRQAKSRVLRRLRVALGDQPD